MCLKRQCSPHSTPVICQRVFFLIAENDSFRLCIDRFKYFYMQYFYQFFVAISAVFCKQRMCLCFFKKNVLDSLFPLAVGCGKGWAVFHMFAQVQIKGKRFTQL